jgi:hypothetical protein
MSALRASQLGAAGQPSSTIISNGPAPPPKSAGFQMGPAIANTAAAAMASRSANSGHGVRAGV